MGKSERFLQRAFTVIFAATIVIWFLQSFDTSLNMVTDSKDSILAMIAGALSPVFAPLGFGDWRISTALVTGFMAKRKCCLDADGVVRHYGSASWNDHGGRSCGASRILPVVYSLCGCGCIDQAGAWRKMGDFLLSSANV